MVLEMRGELREERRGEHASVTHTDVLFTDVLFTDVLFGLVSGSLAKGLYVRLYVG